MICNSMSAKVVQELLNPKGRKTAADKAANLKHDPHEEFQNSIYRSNGPESSTLVEILTTSFKQSMKGAVRHVPGATMVQIGQLVTVLGERTSVHGDPHIFCAVTRSADINKTPDVRTRCILPRWACKLEISFIKPQVNTKTVIGLLANAGMTQGVGDWRTEKGSGNYGSFEIVQPTNPEFKRLLKIGYDQQLEAMDNYIPHDLETQKLLAQFMKDIDARGKSEMLFINRKDKASA